MQAQSTGFAWSQHVSTQRYVEQAYCYVEGTSSKQTSAICNARTGTDTTGRACRATPRCPRSGISDTLKYLEVWVVGIELIGPVVVSGLVHDADRMRLQVMGWFIAARKTKCVGSAAREHRL